MENAPSLAIPQDLTIHKQDGGGAGSGGRGKGGQGLSILH